MRRRTKVIIGAAAVIGAASLLGGSPRTGCRAATTPTRVRRRPRSPGAALEAASAAALAFTGGGTVTETEVGDEESYYEVEVTLDNGNQVDVQLDESFAVVSSKQDSGE